MSYEEDSDSTLHKETKPLSLETQCLNIEHAFINMYQSLPLLWDVKHVDYSNKYKRNVAYDKLLVILKKANHLATRYNVRQKINILRSCYRKDLRKYLASKTISSDGEIAYEYVPTSWKFNKLRFLDGNNKCSLNKNGIAEVNIEDHNYEEQASVQYSEDSHSDHACHDDETPQVLIDTLQTYNDTSYSSRRRHQRKKVKVELDRDEYFLNTDNNELLDKELESVGANVACKLKRMNAQQRYHAELLINKVLIKGLKDCLTEDTDLTDVWNV